MVKALKIKRPSIYPVLDLKVLISIEVACATVSVPRMSYTNLFVILGTERKGGEMWDNLAVLGGRTLERRCWSKIASPKAVLQITFHYWDNVKMSENLSQPFQNVWDRICNTGKTPIKEKAMLTLTKISSYYICCCSLPSEAQHLHLSSVHQGEMHINIQSFLINSSCKQAKKPFPCSLTFSMSVETPRPSGGSLISQIQKVFGQ